MRKVKRNGEKGRGWEKNKGGRKRRETPRDGDSEGPGMRTGRTWSQSQPAPSCAFQTRYHWEPLKSYLFFIVNQLL